MERNTIMMLIVLAIFVLVLALVVVGGNGLFGWELRPVDKEPECKPPICAPVPAPVPETPPAPPQCSGDCDLCECDSCNCSDNCLDEVREIIVRHVHEHTWPEVTIEHDHTVEYEFKKPPCDKEDPCKDYTPPERNKWKKVRLFEGCDQVGKIWISSGKSYHIILEDMEGKQWTFGQEVDVSVLPPPQQ